jgi:hypothetical protein
MRSNGGSSVMSSPKKRMRPAVGGKSPVMALNSVVLPAPLLPSTAYFWPAATASDTSSTARNAPNARVTLCSVSASLDASADAAAAPARATLRAAAGADRMSVTEATGAFASSAQGHAGTSRVPILKSSAFMPSS